MNEKTDTGAKLIGFPFGTEMHPTSFRGEQVFAAAIQPAFVFMHGFKASPEHMLALLKTDKGLQQDLNDAVVAAVISVLRERFPELTGDKE